jgi:outer membrane usher protein FimD/PapC
MRVSPLPRMVREHVLRFTASAGLTRTHDLHAGLLDFSSQYGLNNVSTAQGAVQWTRHFNAQSAGIAISTHVGALAIDIDHAAAHTGALIRSKTQAQTEAEADTTTGKTVETRAETKAETQDGVPRHAFGARLHYSQVWPRVHASLTLSTTAHVGRIPLEWNIWATRFSRAPMDRTKPTANAPLRRDEACTAVPFARKTTLTARWTQSWRSRLAWYLAGSASQTNPTSCATCHSSRFHVDIGASTTVAGIAVSAHLSYSRTPGNAPATTRVLIDLRSHIGHRPTPVQLAWRTEFDNDGRVSRRLSLNGEALSSTLHDRIGLTPIDYSLAFACRHATAPGTEQRSALATHALFHSIGACAGQPLLDLSHHDPWGATQLSIQDKRSLSMIRAGSLLVHRHGITLGPSTGETLALIDTHGVAGLAVSGARSSTNRGGYALMPWLQPYPVNTVDIDRALMPREVALDAASANVVPAASAIVHVRFDARLERTRKLRVVLTDGRPAPFGASVRDAHAHVVATITQAGCLNLPVDAQAPLRVVHEASGTDCALALPAPDSMDSIDSTTSVRGVGPHPHPAGQQPRRVIAHCR